MVDRKAEPASQRYRESSKRLLMRWLDLGALSDENVKLRNLLYDEVTRLPTVSLLLNNIRSLLKTHKQVGVIYIDVDTDSRFEQTFGYRAMEGLMNQVGIALSQLKGEVFRSKDAVATVVKSGNDFVILLAPPREKQAMEMENLFKVRKRVLKGLRDAINKSLDPSICRRFHCRAGAAIIEDEPDTRVEHLVYDALEAAKECAQVKELEKKEKQLDELRLIIDRRDITTLFQPIVDLSSFNTLGYEALSRGPSEDLEYPERLFKLATEGDLIWKLDRTCREKAFMAAKNMPAELLFVNIDPHAIGDPEFKELAESIYLKHSDISPDRLVFDLSVQAAMGDFDLFRLVIHYFKSLGLKISLDDSGNGHYAGLEIIARTKPSFVKIDIPLVRDIEKDDVKQDLVSTITRFASKAGSVVGAEGIETESELKTLKKLGVEIGQGYLFAKPGKPFPSATRPKEKHKEK